MDLRFTPEELAFRDQVRTFMRTALPADIRSKLVGAMASINKKIGR